MPRRLSSSATPRHSTPCYQPDRAPRLGGGGAPPQPAPPAELGRQRFLGAVRHSADHTLLRQKATIAQIHGYCYGGHHELALVCDIAIASEDARLTHPGYCYIGPLGSIVLFMHTVGVRKVKEMVLTGTPLNAQEALDCGLINRMVPLDKFEEEVDKVAQTIAQQPFDAIVIGKANFERPWTSWG